MEYNECGLFIRPKFVFRAPAFRNADEMLAIGFQSGVERAFHITEGPGSKKNILQGALFYRRECKNRNLPEEERRNTAYHEAGHALIGKMLPK